MKDVSIIVPTYNEAKRIGPFLTDLLEFAKLNLRNYEIIIVDDGSIDNTLEIVRKIVKKDKNVRVISYRPNRGKGFAVKKGVFVSKGKLILFIDADGSINPWEIPNLLEKLKNYDVVVGDRGAAESEVKQAKSRKVISMIFNFYVALLFSTRIRDNLCGFKGFKREVARDLFRDLLTERWLFDVELFYKIRKKKYSIYNLPIKWQHKRGSKIRFIDPFKMLFELILLKIKLIGR